jgi:hypothetical protein
MIDRNDVRALRNMIEEARIILNTTTLPKGRTDRARELLDASVKLADGMIATPTAAMLARRRGLRIGGAE